MDDTTLMIYESQAATYASNRPPSRIEAAERFLAEAVRDLPILDAGCGTGSYQPTLRRHPAGVVGTDVAQAMLAIAAEVSDAATLVRARHEALPFADRSLGGAWSRHSTVHTPHHDLPMVLRSFRRVIVDGAPLHLSAIGGVADEVLVSTAADDDLPGRTFVRWTAQHLEDLAVGAGFDAVCEVGERTLRDDTVVTDVWLAATWARSIADTVGPGMRVLVCGLNPSLHAADAGVGFVTPGNRFWPAALEVGLASRDRDPEHALREHGLGMTDLVKRATTKASEVSRDEFRTGLERVGRMVERLRPNVVCFVGLQGWRAAVDRAATAGVQDGLLGGRPVYVMPSTSGLNASSKPADFVDHFTAVLELAERST